MEQSATGASSTVRVRGDWFLNLWAVVAAFGCYFCMYAFRKPFTAAKFEDTELWGAGFKTILVVAQVIGYTLSKFAGIRVIAQMPPHRRARTILWLIGLAELALLLFGIVPRPWNVVCLFLNGLPLGLVFGLVLGFLEGRRMTEALTAGLCASFILADGVTKTVGGWLLSAGVVEDWMPFVAGAIFLLPLFLFVAMLSRVPPPSLMDIESRAERYPMSREQRWAFLRRYGPGLVTIIVVFLLVTILRSVRADFQPEIWRDLGVEQPGSVFTTSELWVALGVLLVNGGTIWIRDNRLAFFTSLWVCAGGFVLLALTLLGRQNGSVNDFAFMVLVGLGLYLPYVAIHTTVFERMLAMTRERGNIGFLMYVVDSLGYLGYVAVMLVRNFGSVSGSMLQWMVWMSWFSILVSLGCLVVGAFWFACLATSAEKPLVEPVKIV